MKRVVIDTNILVSAHISSRGNPALIMRMVSYGELQLVYSTEILDEYKRVLAYEKLDIPVQAQNKAIEAVKALGLLVEPIKSSIPLPDESDRAFYDAAKLSGATLITGNIKHFPAEQSIMTPADFVNSLDVGAQA